jgi:UDP-GlcNAc3NAcA epimerase
VQKEPDGGNLKSFGIFNVPGMNASKKIVTIVGARPQFIKAAMMSRAISRYNRRVLVETDGIEEITVHTGQHYDRNMSDIFYDDLKLPAAQYHLGIRSNSHGAMTGKMLEKTEAVLLKERPDLVIVYGDTNSTLAGALAAVKLNLPVAHVEAGLRSFNRNMPEEVNRVITDSISTWLFCPTPGAVENLKKEGITGNVFDAGDVMFDAHLFHASRAESKSRILDALNLNAQGYVLTTVHRSENTDDPRRLRSIVKAWIRLSKKITIVLPLHPRTKSALEKQDLLADVSQRFKVIEPVGYLDMLMLEKNASLILTDSGGIQKEAYFSEVPCVTLRNETEWAELVESGYNILAGADEAAILKAASGFLSSDRSPVFRHKFYGAGQSADDILTIIRDRL